MKVKLFETEGLGDNSYIVQSGKEVAIVDPQRDVWRFTEMIDENDLKLKYILETHVHNDYISGALELKDRYRGVDLALPKLGDYEFEHKGVREGDSLKLGTVELSVLDTPGHTYEHISWVAKQGKQELGAFTGGSLIVGSAGRTDLLGHDHTHELTKLQFESMQKYRQFSNDLKIYPTHGQGSFCTSANTDASRTSTLEREYQINQALKIKEEQEFIKTILSGLKKYPDYYPYMAPINKKGPKIYGNLPEPKPLNLEEFKEVSKTATIVDTRHGKDFARIHVPNSYNFQMANSTFSYIGWILPFNSPIVIISGDDYQSDAFELTTQLFRIGFENVKGYLDGGIQTWIEAGQKTKSYHAEDVHEIDLGNINPSRMIDIRDPEEIKETPMDGVSTIFLSEIPQKNLQKDNYYVYCVSGQRAATAASLLELAGKDVTLIYNGGIEELRAKSN